MFLEWLPAVEGHGLKFFKKASSNRKGAVLFGDYHYIRQTEKGGGSVLEGCHYDRSYLRESEQATLEKLCTGFEGKTRIASGPFSEVCQVNLILLEGIVMTNDKDKNAIREWDDMPGMASLSAYRDNPPVLPEELITGILRRGHKMLISGSSKAGKSFLLMELCVALAEGTPWLGFPCRKGRVLYVNLEIDPASCVTRFLKIYEALGLEMKHTDDIVIWNLRGCAVSFDRLVPKLIQRVRRQNFAAIVIDPIYKVIKGDENRASEVGQFFNRFDQICVETGCAMICCHHHSKGAQGTKRAMDRASGSGVFARDPDAHLDMIQIDIPGVFADAVRDRHATAWRLESNLREFENIEPLNFWFEYPIHRVDEEGILGSRPAQGGMKM